MPRESAVISVNKIKLIINATPRSLALPFCGRLRPMKRRETAIDVVRYMFIELSSVAVHCQVARVDHYRGAHHLVWASIERILKLVGRPWFWICPANQGYTHRANKLKITAISGRCCPKRVRRIETIGRSARIDGAVPGRGAHLETDDLLGDDVRIPILLTSQFRILWVADVNCIRRGFKLHHPVGGAECSSEVRGIGIGDVQWI